MPDARAALSGLSLANGTRENLARACVEGMLRGLEVGRELIAAAGTEVTSIKIIGGAAANLGVRKVAQEMFGAVVSFPAPEEYVALGAARQASRLVG